ncbi:hypothetical protein BDW22DRAFT_800266 [Trametopsis cervina]|nr:hypothetical protein BDW22DRAFT_800266 [Trametopsis cervina]
MSNSSSRTPSSGDSPTRSDEGSQYGQLQEILSEQDPLQHGVQLDLPHIAVKNAGRTFLPQKSIRFYSYGRVGFSLMDAMNSNFDGLAGASHPAFQRRIPKGVTLNLQWSDAQDDQFELSFDRSRGYQAWGNMFPMSGVAELVALLVWEKFEAEGNTQRMDDPFIMFDDERMYFKDLYVLTVRQATADTFYPVLSWNV